MFDWLGDLLSGLGDALGSAFDNIGSDVVTSIWNGMVQWLYESIYSAVGELFLDINSMGIEIFELSWVRAFVDLFSLLGWALFTAGLIAAVFDVAIESQNGRVNIKNTAMNVLKGFFACSLIGILPVELYMWCCTLQGVFMKDLAAVLADGQSASVGELAAQTLAVSFVSDGVAQIGLKIVFFLLAFSYCVIKVFFSNIKRGGILLIQIAVGSLYMFSVPRGYTDGFYQWCKQMVAICLTAFLQTTLLFLGMLTFSGNMLLGLGIMLAAGEVPRIAQQFGLDSGIKVSMTSIMRTTSAAVTTARTVFPSVRS